MDGGNVPFLGRLKVIGEDTCRIVGVEARILYIPGEEQDDPGASNNLWVPGEELMHQRTDKRMDAPKVTVMEAENQMVNQSTFTGIQFDSKHIEVLLTP